MQFLGGLASGFFIPLTLSFILLNTPPKYWAFGIAIYALNLELSLNISASLEGWYVEHHLLALDLLAERAARLASCRCACSRGIAHQADHRPPADRSLRSASRAARDSR